MMRMTERVSKVFSGMGTPGAQQKGHQPVREVVGSKGAAQKTGQGDGNLNGCQELGRAAGEPGQPAGRACPLGLPAAPACCR